MIKMPGKAKTISVQTEKGDEANESVLVLGQDQSIRYSDKVRQEGSTWTAPDLGISLPGHLKPVPYLSLKRIGRSPVATGRRMIFALTDTLNPGADDQWVKNTLSNIRLQASEGRRPDQQKQNPVTRNAHLIAAALGLGLFALMALPLIREQLGAL